MKPVRIRIALLLALGAACPMVAAAQDISPPKPPTDAVPSPPATPPVPNVPTPPKAPPPPQNQLPPPPTQTPPERLPQAPTTAKLPANPSMPNMQMPSFASMDANKDGFVSRTELPAQSPLSSQFARLDSNGDGKLSPAEFAAGQGKGGG